jgi:hypothetical protein
MRLYNSWRFTRSASLPTTTILLCLGVFLLCWPASGTEVSAALTMADAPPAEQAHNGDEQPLDGDYIAVFAAEGEAGEKLPKNAALLRTLVLLLFFGPVLGWIVVSGWMRRSPEICSTIRCWFHSVVHLHQRRAVATLLEVFRL